jgi:hypothetical protein
VPPQLGQITGFRALLADSFFREIWFYQMSLIITAHISVVAKTRTKIPIMKIFVYKIPMERRILSA